MEEELSKYKKTIVSLVKAHYDNNEEEFKKCSKDIADYFMKTNQDQLGEYLSAQLGEGPIFYV